MFCPVMETHVVGTAGAGDAFNSTFAAYIALKRSPDEALRAAAVNSASVVGHVDTQTGLLSRDDIDKRAAAEKDTLRVRIWSH